MPKRKYEFDPNPLSTHARVARLVGGNKTVLDIGCAGGYIGAQLAQAGCTVDGIDLDSLEPGNRKAYRKFWKADVEKLSVKGKYDVVILADILEHLREPGALLKKLGANLKAGGHLVVSIPNVANWKTRLHLLSGNWRYRETGILDRTHLKFYTRASARALLESNGYKIEHEEWTGFLGSAWMWPSLLAFQFIFKAAKV